MLSELNGEIRNCRIRFNVTWCPFCDRSRQFGDIWDLQSGVRCNGCDAVFKEVEVVTEEASTTPRRRRRATAEELEQNTAEEVAADVASEEATDEE